jgi:hypothetical protein
MALCKTSYDDYLTNIVFHITIIGYIIIKIDIQNFLNLYAIWKKY